MRWPRRSACRCPVAPRSRRRTVSAPRLPTIPACAPSKSCTRISNPPTFSHARLSRTPSLPARLSAARPMRRPTSMLSPAMSASSGRSRIGKRSASTCRCWSTCSRPENISARSISAPAVCRRGCGSTNAPIDITAFARHVGVKLSIEDWEKVGFDVPLLVNMQPAGKYLGEEYHRAGGLPAVMHELLRAKRLHGDALTINGKTVADNVRHAKVQDAEVTRPYGKPLKKSAGFRVLSGNLFDSAVMKTSVISDEFRKRYLSDPIDPNAFEGRAVVFEGPEDYHHRIDNPSLKIDEQTILFIRGAGAIGYPGAAEVVNMQPPAALIKKGITSLPCIGDGRQSGTSASPSILNASPEAAAGGGLALLKTNDRVRIDLNKGTANILISKAELARRRAKLLKLGGFKYPASQTPWQEIQRDMVDQLSGGM